MRILKRLREIEHMLDEQGIRYRAVEQKGRMTHVKVTLDNGRKVFVSHTPSDRRADQNFLSNARKEAQHG